MVPALDTKLGERSSPADGDRRRRRIREEQNSPDDIRSTLHNEYLRERSAQKICKEDPEALTHRSLRTRMSNRSVRRVTPERRPPRKPRESAYKGSYRDRSPESVLYSSDDPDSPSSPKRKRVDNEKHDIKEEERLSRTSSRRLSPRQSTSFYQEEEDDDDTVGTDTEVKVNEALLNAVMYEDEMDIGNEMVVEGEVPNVQEEEDADFEEEESMEIEGQEDVTDEDSETLGSSSESEEVEEEEESSSGESSKEEVENTASIQEIGDTEGAEIEDNAVSTVTEDDTEVEEEDVNDSQGEGLEAELHEMAVSEDEETLGRDSENQDLEEEEESSSTTIEGEENAAASDHPVDIVDGLNGNAEDDDAQSITFTIPSMESSSGGQSGDNEEEPEPMGVEQAPPVPIFDFQNHPQPPLQPPQNHVEPPPPAAELTPEMLYYLSVVWPTLTMAQLIIQQEQQQQMLLLQRMAMFQFIEMNMARLANAFVPPGNTSIPVPEENQQFPMNGFQENFENLEEHGTEVFGSSDRSEWGRMSTDTSVESFEEGVMTFSDISDDPMEEPMTQEEAPSTATQESATAAVEEPSVPRDPSIPPGIQLLDVRVVLERCDVHPNDNRSL